MLLYPQPTVLTKTTSSPDRQGARFADLFERKGVPEMPAVRIRGSDTRLFAEARPQFEMPQTLSMGRSADYESGRHDRRAKSGSEMNRCRHAGDRESMLPAWPKHLR